MSTATPASATFPASSANLSADIEKQFTAKGIKDRPAYLKAKKIGGHKLAFRDAVADDAAFIVALRTNEQKARYISQTSPDVAQQRLWLDNYAQDDRQVYFIIENNAQEPLGTVRLYDRQGDSFCWGSWILQAGAPSSSAIESALMVYHYALALGFRQAHFEVRKANESVWKFHERFGAIKNAETAEDFYYTIAAADIANSLDRYAKFLPKGITIEF